MADKALQKGYTKRYLPESAWASLSKKNGRKPIKRNAKLAARESSLYQTPGKQSLLDGPHAVTATVNHDILTAEQYRSRGNSRNPFHVTNVVLTAVEREGSYDPGITTGIFCDYSCCQRAANQSVGEARILTRLEGWTWGIHPRLLGDLQVVDWTCVVF